VRRSGSRPSLRSLTLFPSGSGLILVMNLLTISEEYMCIEAKEGQRKKQSLRCQESKTICSQQVSLSETGGVSVYELVKKCDHYPH
jgi:hypothetical protein